MKKKAIQIVWLFKGANVPQLDVLDGYWLVMFTYCYMLIHNEDVEPSIIVTLFITYSFNFFFIYFEYHRS